MIFMLLCYGVVFDKMINNDPFYENSVFSGHEICMQINNIRVRN